MLGWQTAESQPGSAEPRGCSEPAAREMLQLPPAFHRLGKLVHDPKMHMQATNLCGISQYP